MSRVFDGRLLVVVQLYVGSSSGELVPEKKLSPEIDWLSAGGT
jgi:hypothetical protein